MRFVDFFKEEFQDMRKIKQRRENFLSSSTSPRLLLSRWLSSLTPRSGFTSSAASSSKRKSDADVKVEMTRNGSKTVVGSLAQVAPESGDSLEFVFAGVDNGQRITEDTKFKEFLMDDCGKGGQLGSQLLTGSIDGVRNVCTLPLIEAGECNKPILKHSKAKSCSSMEDVATCSASADKAVLSGHLVPMLFFTLHTFLLIKLIVILLLLLGHIPCS